VATWRYDWTISISVDDEKFQKQDKGDLYDELNEQLQALSDYARMRGIKVESKAIHANNPDMVE
jgi:hypothetical protein